MNRITKLVNRFDKALAPLGELVKDENFKGELLAAAGAKEKPTAEGKAEMNRVLKFLLDTLNDFRKKLGLDKSDIPNVSNIAGLAIVLAELYIVFQALRDLLKSCDYFGLEDADEDDTELENAINNALGAIGRFLSQNAIKKTHPTIATLGDALGIFSDELNETKRALDLALFWLLRLLKILIDDIDPDCFRPVGDVKADEPLRLTKSIFLTLSILSAALNSKISPIGTFLFDMGNELDPSKDIFPNAAKISGRFLQMQFVPGEALSFADDEPYPETFRNPNSTDCVLSFATIPVFAPNAEPADEPEGYQYLLGFELNPGHFGDDVGNFSITFPANLVGYLIWGHDTDFHAVSSGVLGTEPLIEIRWKGKKEGEANQGAENKEDVQSGDVFFKFHPKKKMVNGQEELDVELSLELHDFSYSISGEGRDGFVQKVLPEDSAAKMKVSLTIVYSPLLNKWTIEGLDKNDGFLFLFNIGKTLFKKIEIPTLYVGLKPHIDEEKSIRGVALEASAMIKFNPGPFQMTVDRLGLNLFLDFPKKSDGNLGFANLDYGLKPPTGVGFIFGASVVTGGGFLSIDPENHQYYGAGELTVQFELFKMSLKVFAIILTQLPDGTKGFSFLLIASVEFEPPFDGPLGFKLKGVGVMVSLHRSMNLEAFQQAIRDDRFNSVLFPDNPVGNAPTIVKALNSLFPAVQDRYVFALMARIGWGATKLVDLKLGLLVEVPTPVKIALVGVLKVTIEEGGIRIMNLQVNFIVALDFGKKIFSIDAGIYNSKLLIFDIRGEMFVRYRWGQDSVFLVSVGGWHPDFQVPSGLNLPDKPQRLSIPLLEGEKLSLILSCYMAFTPNTVQAGFKIDFKMKWSKFRLEALLAVDALFHFEPFYFVVDFEGKLRIFWGDSTLAGVTVKGKFSGTNPWRIRGTATFEIWIWDYDVDFDKSSGDELSSVTQDVDVLPLIEKAISDKANWQSSLPRGKSTNIILRKTDEDFDPNAADTEPAAGPIIADPISMLEVRQQVTPLGIRIDKLGFQKVAGSRKFDLEADTANGENLESDDLEDHFAPAMFIDMEDAEKLSRKSFEPMKAGRSFANLETVLSGAAQISVCEFDNEFNDPLAPEIKAEVPPVSKENFQRWLGNNSVARSVEGRKSISLKEIETRKKSSKVDAFIVTDTVTGEKVSEAVGQKNMTAAFYELWKLQRINPLRKMNVVRESEIREPVIIIL